MLQFCGYCAELIGIGSITRHCKDKHSKSRLVLKDKMIPSDPKFENWKQWIEDPAKVTPWVIPKCFKRPADLEMLE